ncbi:unnamed protein product [Plutella xylostella]|uniref:(diamondback moth) hypothetical protein n=1 Tax=Plutella xylostella TaxID=51655 RepID=A0A8S4D9R4_PLUXY|nr:unnamed protein product [Plutella xylostella]
MDFNIFLKIIILFQNFIFLDGVPDPYCFARLNTSNCGKKTTSVFYYYKPRSRCEIGFWRGCPTDNIFSNEYECSNRCVGWLIQRDGKGTGKNKRPGIGDGKITEPYKPHWCQEALNQEQCHKNETVYTYDWNSKSCMSKNWYGCPCDNKFRTLLQCKQICSYGVNRLKSIESINDEIKQDKRILTALRGIITTPLPTTTPLLERPRTTLGPTTTITEPTTKILETITTIENSTTTTEKPTEPSTKTVKTSTTIEKPSITTEKSTTTSEKPTTTTVTSTTVEQPPTTTEKSTTTTEKPTTTTVTSTTVEQPCTTTEKSTTTTEKPTTTTVETTTTTKETTAAPVAKNIKTPRPPRKSPNKTESQGGVEVIS